MSKKTLVISEIFPPRHGGSGRWFYELYRRLPRDIYTIIAGSANRDKEFDDANINALRIQRLDLYSPSWGIRSITGLRFYWRTFRALSKIIREQRIEALHCGRCLPEGFIGWLLHLRHGIPYLCFVHGEDIQTAMESRELSFLIHRVFRSSAVLICNSENTASILTREWSVNRGQLRVLHPGMDGERFVPAPPDGDFQRSQGWQDRRVALTVGRLQKRKGHDMLIKALALLTPTHPDLLYAIIGDGDERRALEKLVQEYGLEEHVQFLGEVDDNQLVAYYQQCTLFALPNRADGNDIEGFGMVLAEAQACGRPVLAGDSGGTRETLLDGVTGVVCDCTAPEPLAAALQNLLGDPQCLLSMGQKARAHVLDKLDWQAHTLRASELFAEAGT
ncbi:glycosyltransferase family 4 protein [Congregibacter variabilis]|uniref:Glycosyltransferase family 4 protein n=1 Tax=Congregibacter variabilis TaxID=3081200 RepID=A0ABZ0I7K2_9GAMM|nr:glycosyltransferase family 4 protein [Congregibacter sp. IMCC43200]